MDLLQIGSKPVIQPQI